MTNIQSPLPEGMGQGRIFAHFTNGRGVTGITGIDAETLVVGQQEIVRELQFGQGKNDFLCPREDKNCIFVTDLGLDATERQLAQIGVFGDRQKFALLFSEETAFLQSARVMPADSERGIYYIPGNTTLRGVFVVMRIRL